jgi:hypothetical protein
MATHQKYRLLVNSTTVGTYTVLAGLELRATQSGSNLAVTGNGTASSSTEMFEGQGNGSAGAFDSNDSTRWFGNGPTSWIQWDFGVGNEQDIRWMTLVVPSSNTEGFPITGTLQYLATTGGWVDFIPFVSPNPNTRYGAHDLYSAVGWGFVADLQAPAATVFSGNPSTGSALLTGPRTAVAAGLIGSATFAYTATKPTLASATGAVIGLVAPAAFTTSAGHDSTGENSLTYTLPAPKLTALGGANASLKMPSGVLSIGATVTNFGAAALTAPSATVTAAATATASARAALTFGSVLGTTYDIVGFSGAVISVTVGGSPTVKASGTVGGTASATITLPLYNLSAAGSAQSHGGASLLMPAPFLSTSGALAWLMSPSAQLTAIGSATVAVTYEAYAVNLNHTPRPGVDPVDEVTHYTSYPFDRIVRYKNSYFGMNSTGLYLLEGTTDVGADVAWAWKTGETDFKSPQKKTVEMAYFGGRLPPASVVSLIAREDAPVTYSYTTPRGAHAQNYRQPFGRGLKARYYSFGVAGSGELAIDSVTLNVTTLARKV